jgi:integrase
MRDLDYDRVSRFRASLSKPKANGDRPAPSSIKRTMLVLNLVCEYARKRKLIVENPCADLDPIKSRKPVQKMPNTEDVERLIARLSSPTPGRRHPEGLTLKARPADPRWPLLVETAAYTGLRAGELAGLQVRDLNFFNGSLRVERTVVALYGKDQPDSGLRIDTPKSEAGVRTIEGIDTELMERLRAHCTDKSQRDFLFGDRDEAGNPRPMHHGNIYRRVIKPAADELGIDMTFHGLRHHAGSLWLDLGMSIVEVAARLGHSSAAFTLRTYTHELRHDSTDYAQAIRERRAGARGETPKVRRLRSKKPF